MYSDVRKASAHGREMPILPGTIVNQNGCD